MLRGTPADADDRAQAGQLAEAVQATTGNSVDPAYVGQGYTDEKPAKASREHGIEREVVKLSQAKRGPHPAVVEGPPAAAPLGFVRKALDRWASENNVTPGFSSLGKPNDNAPATTLLWDRSMGGCGTRA